MTSSLSLTLYKAVMSSLRLVLPAYLARRAKAGKEDALRMAERYGKGYASVPKQGMRFWLHAVSVGEATAALALAHALLQSQKQAHIIITTGTTTAAKTIDSKAQEQNITHVYAPFDAPCYVERFFAHHQPDCGIIFESDFWPCLMSMAHEKAIPLYLASAQISDDSLVMWQKVPALAEAIFSDIRWCFAHDDTHARNFAKLGVPNCKVTGSLKLVAIERTKTQYAKDLSAAATGRLVLLAASTHPGEDAQILAISDYLTQMAVPHFLIIAPRHPERGDEIARLCPDAKRRSRHELPEAGDMIYISDSLGDMPSLYQASDIVWLGATFSGKGGHNPLEAAAYGKPILCGPSQFKNQYEFDQLTRLGVCTMISDSRASAQYIAALYNDKDKCAAIAKSGKAYAARARKRPDKVCDMILRDLSTLQQSSS